ncbi:hypothetical protein HK405_007144, partial [Cladochytrium tenue]
MTPLIVPVATTAATTARAFAAAAPAVATAAPLLLRRPLASPAAAWAALRPASSALRMMSSSPDQSLFSLGELNHVAIAVPDLEKASAYYRDVLRADVSEPH